MADKKQNSAQLSDRYPTRSIARLRPISRGATVMVIGGHQEQACGDDKNMRRSEFARSNGRGMFTLSNTNAPRSGKLS